ncbi:Craniofacial development protein 2 [Varanus komodoensis]|nr:Craniofacial development protein 2 [Varanus komodoensis]
MSSVRIQSKPFKITIVQVYAPTTDAEEAEVDQFYEGLQHLLELTPKNDFLIIMGDWNAKVGSQKITGMTGKFGLGVQNEAGHRLVEFCKENMLAIANIIFQQHKRLYTGTAPDSQQRNQIDYVLCSQRWRSSIQSVKMRPGADCGSDDELLVAKFRLKLKKSGKSTRPLSAPDTNNTAFRVISTEYANYCYTDSLPASGSHSKKVSLEAAADDGMKKGCDLSLDPRETEGREIHSLEQEPHSEASSLCDLRRKPSKKGRGNTDLISSALKILELMDQEDSGETRYNKEKILQGQGIDEPLSETGFKQANAAGIFLSNVRFTHVFASDLIRAKQTVASILSKSHFCKEAAVKYDARLRERKYGVAEGKPLSDLKFMAKVSGEQCPYFTPAGGETLDEKKTLLAVLSFFSLVHYCLKVFFSKMFTSVNFQQDLTLNKGVLMNKAKGMGKAIL